MKNKNKIGLGLITCNKQDRFEQSVARIPDGLDCFVVVNDGDPYPDRVYPKGCALIQHQRNKCVGISKNDALRYMIDQDIDHLFLIEDDILIKDPNIFEAYIKAAEVSGIWHLNYGLHGPANKVQTQQGPMNVQERHKLRSDTAPNPRATIEYESGIEIAFYPNCVGAFSYFYRGIIKHIGYHDERFKNCWEHVEHTNRIINAGLHPPFWWFADRADSMNYLDEIPDSIEQSTIAHTPEWMKNFEEGMNWYQHKHGWTPQKTPDTPQPEVLQKLDEIQKNYARKVL